MEQTSIFDALGAPSTLTVHSLPAFTYHMWDHSVLLDIQAKTFEGFIAARVRQANATKEQDVLGVKLPGTQPTNDGDVFRAVVGGLFQVMTRVNTCRAEFLMQFLKTSWLTPYQKFMAMMCMIVYLQKKERKNVLTALAYMVNRPECRSIIEAVGTDTELDLGVYEGLFRLFKHMTTTATRVPRSTLLTFWALWTTATNCEASCIEFLARVGRDDMAAEALQLLKELNIKQKSHFWFLLNTVDVHALIHDLREQGCVEKVRRLIKLNPVAATGGESKEEAALSWHSNGRGERITFRHGGFLPHQLNSLRTGGAFTRSMVMESARILENPHKVQEHLAIELLYDVVQTSVPDVFVPAIAVLCVPAAYDELHRRRQFKPFPATDKELCVNPFHVHARLTMLRDNEDALQAYINGPLTASAKGEMLSYMQFPQKYCEGIWEASRQQVSTIERYIHWGLPYVVPDSAIQAAKLDTNAVFQAWFRTLHSYWCHFHEKDMTFAHVIWAGEALRWLPKEHVLLLACITVHKGRKRNIIDPEEYLPFVTAMGALLPDTNASIPMDESVLLDCIQQCLAVEPEAEVTFFDVRFLSLLGYCGFTLTKSIVALLDRHNTSDITKEPEDILGGIINYPTELQDCIAACLLAGYTKIVPRITATPQVSHRLLHFQSYCFNADIRIQPKFSMQFLRTLTTMDAIWDVDAASTLWLTRLIDMADNVYENGENSFYSNIKLMHEALPAIYEKASVERTTSIYRERIQSIASTCATFFQRLNGSCSEELLRRCLCITNDLCAMTAVEDMVLWQLACLQHVTVAIADFYQQRLQEVTVPMWRELMRLCCNQFAVRAAMNDVTFAQQKFGLWVYHLLPITDFQPTGLLLNAYRFDPRCEHLFGNMDMVALSQHGVITTKSEIPLEFADFLNMAEFSTWKAVIQHYLPFHASPTYVRAIETILHDDSQQDRELSAFAMAHTHTKLKRLFCEEDFHAIHTAYTYKLQEAFMSVLNRMPAGMLVHDNLYNEFVNVFLARAPSSIAYQRPLETLLTGWKDGTLALNALTLDAWLALPSKMVREIAGFLPQLPAFWQMAIALKHDFPAPADEVLDQVDGMPPLVKVAMQTKAADHREVVIAWQWCQRKLKEQALQGKPQEEKEKEMMVDPSDFDDVTLQKIAEVLKDPYLQCIHSDVAVARPVDGSVISTCFDREALENELAKEEPRDIITRTRIQGPVYQVKQLKNIIEILFAALEAQEKAKFEHSDGKK